MEKNFPYALAHVLRHEGGFVHHPRDPGGATNRGITLATYSRWLGRPADVRELAAITDAVVEDIYHDSYWLAVRAHEMPAGVDLALFDWAVLAGPARATKHLQQAARVAADGIIGPITMRSVQGADPLLVLADLLNIRADYLDDLGIWATFGRGWSRRTVSTWWAARSLATDPS